MNYQTLERTIGHQFADIGLLDLAMTHPSYALQHKCQDNQRLEFLGDAVLEICVSRVLYHKYPKLREGQLTRKRAALVCEANLARAATRLGLGSYLKLDRGEEVVGGRENPSILADTMEAVIQGKKTLSSPMKSLGADLAAKRIVYQNNPILKGCLANTAVDIDKNNNIQPCKGNSPTRRIDGLAGLLDAYVVLENHLEEYQSLI